MPDAYDLARLNAQVAKRNLELSTGNLWLCAVVGTAAVGNVVNTAFHWTWLTVLVFVLWAGAFLGFIRQYRRVRKVVR